MKKEINLMIADDHAIIRDGIKLMIKKEPLIKLIYEAKDGLDAIKFIEENPSKIDVVLMDISMPKFDGFAATRSIKLNHPNIAVLALTMHTEESYVIDMMKAGVSGYILKDSGKEELIDAIKKVADGKLYYSSEVSSIVISSLVNGNGSENKKTKDAVSKREKEIAILIAQGLTSGEISKQLFLSQRTIEAHRRNMITKLNLKNSAELISYTIKHGWI